MTARPQSQTRSRGSAHRLLLLGVGTFFSLLATPVHAQGPIVATNALRADFWDTDGPIHALAARDGVVFVGGDFSYIAPRGRKVAAVDAYTAEPMREFPAVTGNAVFAIVSDQQGGWFLGGDFTSVGGWPRTNLVHVRADQTIDPTFQPNPSGAVRALVLDGATLYLGGDFKIGRASCRERV